jgi:hypothetical protein
LFYESTETAAVFNLQIVNEIYLRKQTLGPGTSRERDMCIRKQQTQLAQRRYSNHRIANPICAAHDNPLDVLKVGSHYQAQNWGVAN